MKFIDIVNICRKDLTEQERKTLAKVLLSEGELLFVSDGAVTPDCMVWWKSENGPVHGLALEHEENIKDFPEFYSIAKPKCKVTYL